MSTALSEGEVAHFHERGYLPPFDLVPPEQMAALRPELERIFADEHGGHNSHQYAAAVWELASRREIVGRMASLLGEDLSIWRTNFFVKEPAGSRSPLTREIPFHQDRNYWPLEPAVILSAWIAVTDSTPEMGCVEIIPGSHRLVVPHIDLGREDELPSNFVVGADPASFDESTRVSVPMSAGQVLLFNERTLHSSQPNRTAERRIGLAVRVVPPLVKVLSYDAPWHKLVPVSGDPASRLAFNAFAEPGQFELGAREAQQGKL